MPATLESLAIDALPIPASLKKYPAWILWKYVQTDKRIEKRPYSVSGYPAKVNEPEEWGTFEEAVAAYEAGVIGADGLGFVFSPTNKVCGIDLDHCLDKETGAIQPWAAQLVRQLNAYTEVSPSGTGLHILALAELQGRGQRREPLEIYDGTVEGSGRYFTVTGRHVAGTPDEVKERQGPITALYSALKPIADLLSNPEKRTAFERLFIGDTSAYHGDDSVADLAFCNMVVGTGATPLQCHHAMYLSGLYRAKWNEKRGSQTYGQMTVAKAQSGISATHQPMIKDPPQQPKTPQVGWVGHAQSARALAQKSIPPVRWAVPDLIPDGLTLLAGASKIGKSWAALALGVAVAQGTRLFNYFPTTQGRVLYLALEDSERRMQGRLDVVCPEEAPEGLSIAYRSPMMSDPTFLEGFEQWRAQAPGARLIIVDVLGKIQQRATRNTNAYHTDYDALAPLQRFALEWGIGIVAVTHTNQRPEKELGDILQAVQGTTGTIGCADTVLLLRRARQTSEGRLDVVSRDIPEGTFDTTFDDGLWIVTGKHTTGRPGPKPTAIDTAKAFLLSLLADGPQPQQTITTRAGEQGLTQWALRTAKSRLGVKATKNNGAWYWAFPAPAQSAPKPDAGVLPTPTGEDVWEQVIDNEAEERDWKRHYHS